MRAGTRLRTRGPGDGSDGARMGDSHHTLDSAPLVSLRWTGTMTLGPAPIDGTCDPRFAAVRDAFAENFAERGEVGAAVAISVRGRVVVDLWGGWADRARRGPW